MKLSKLYSNKDFINISFNEGFNVIQAEITDKSNKNRDTHNLGKTLLISVIDFVLLKSINQKEKYFLTKGGFEGQIFYLEIKLNSGKYLIIRREIDNPTKISFKLNDFKLDGFVLNLNWDEENISFDKAKSLLNSYLNFNIIPNWSYRKSINYFLRTQHDFRDVFKLDKFKSKDKDWKPFMFDLLGFHGKIIQQKYDFEEKNKLLLNKLKTLQQEANININDKDKIQGFLEIKKNDKNKIERFIDNFNFYSIDKEKTLELVEIIDLKLQTLNTQRYNLSYELKKIEESLKHKSNVVDINRLKELFQDIKLYFPDNLTKDFEDLILFNKSIAEERMKYLKENLDLIKNELTQIDKDIIQFEKEKEEKLHYLTEKDVYEKFKENQRFLSKIEADIILLEEKLKIIDNTQIIQEEIEKNSSKINQLIKETKKEIDNQKHSNLRKTFNDIIEKILNTNALISLKQNTEGNIEFEANIQNPVSLSITEEDYGNSYRKLMCIAFDLSLLINFSNESFYRFAYHDGALEGLDNRKKINFLELIRKICNQNKLQYIFTLIDSDLPKDENDNFIYFDNNEISLKLHDKDDTGKLFQNDLVQETKTWFVIKLNYKIH